MNAIPVIISKDVYGIDIIIVSLKNTIIIRSNEVCVVVKLTVPGNSGD